MDNTELKIRKSARRRSSLLPGMGFALLGYPVPAVLGLVLVALAFAAMSAVSFYPGPLLAWMILAATLGSILLWAVEYMAVGRITIRPSGETGSFSRRFKWICILSYLGAAAASICFVLSFGSLRMQGDGMSPVVLRGEIILYHKRVVEADLVPGRLIAFKVSPMSSWGRPGEVVMGRILAGPGNAIGIRRTRYRVNGKESVEVSDVGPYKVVVDIPRAPAEAPVPPECFFVVQEQSSTALDSRTLSWARREDILATRFWLLGRRGTGKALR
jgi:hypothetical protein